MKVLNVELADEHFTLCCRCEENTARLTPYRSETGGEVLQPNEEQEQRIASLLPNTLRRRGRAATPAETEFLALHELAARALAARGVLLLHGSAVVMNGQAAVFLAPSGTGKSTHTRLWQKVFGEKAWIINDDKPLIRVDRERPVIYPSPWGTGKRPTQGNSAPVRALVWLERGKSNAAEPVTQREFFPWLYQSSLQGGTPTEALAVLELQKKLLGTVSLFKMTCTPTEDAAVTAYRAVFGKEP